MTPIDVVGIGADGWDGLAPASRDAVAAAEVLFGSPRQLDAVPLDAAGAQRIPWPTPLLPTLRSTLDEHADRRRCVLASGDPMFHGIGTTLARLVGADTLRVFPHPSSVSLACARLGWSLPDVEVVSLVARDPATVLPALHPSARLIVLAENDTTPTAVAILLRENGFGDARMTVLESLGGRTERVRSTTAGDWRADDVDPLNVVAVEVPVTGPRRTRNPGLPDDAYSGDGQLTKREVRALTLAALDPVPGERLWDVGGGSGSIAIEWMRTHPRCRADTFERVPERARTIADNARALGVPGLEIHGAAPAALTDAPLPDAIFVGGGATAPGMLDACWAALRPGGRMVVNAVTAETEALVFHWFTEHGGTLRRIQIQRGEPVGGFTGWRPQMPVTQWCVVRA
ncbi:MULTISPECIES: bifunctional cobalt-precorrin-7 (C(5))-methyltransferase/cobalt-precorrin-6B (C(15))-methyltransferase [Nocardiaceae]|uniref:Bifunctional cobalt-precorrin-7 (C(5))-methyltransferase/cobalt-precorrin-6B (C(15))-methyltransferase n=1 Tax=Rhodococcoides kroppenstedtii TaxID=293050 RepID=A0ABS7NMR8_9NOCA|nr:MULTISPECIES: bifunctional cobalt-precorrin-7 (C(5))-methyltransferase/cobalt-precorrin-6B (C(15))-methyltransferase [Rhodococcus]AMY19125.1 Precorrin-6Y C(5,15)-methyltransferase [Rhodococcus sp. PBTS 1]MBY6311720.1 bifunctional cobalt-precorrin-7 (C(5))-methyltransferase/cobalt-precorrin-6B (C(15))-methyltransferase [Rhodococcus kroppenstedtii]MBY6319304.1 bifunctional cobalt-precorrin-7 (C(5))-methyltransferase/cobalt-precorrin-6B (C(15))-methyltransferase [Rhodococcus kroppenstedtii]MBY6